VERQLQPQESGPVKPLVDPPDSRIEAAVEADPGRRIEFREGARLRRVGSGRLLDQAR
jgi:hypothetical protein